MVESSSRRGVGDEMFKHNRRQQERFQRAIEERYSRGEEEQAFEKALEDIGLEVPGEPDAEEAWGTANDPGAEEFEDVTWEEAAGADADSSDDIPFEGTSEHHPLLASAMALLKELQDAFRSDEQLPLLRTLIQGAGDAMGGLAQALPCHDEESWPGDYGLRITQLKRALRGTAFASGALINLRRALTAPKFDELHEALKELGKNIFAEISQLRSQHQRDDG